MYTLETRGPFLRSYSLEKLENALENAETDLEFPAQQIFVGYLLLTACDGYGRREGVYVA